jgi:molybdopterin synthase sulfur carrier subunit
VAVVHIPSPMRAFTGGEPKVRVDGGTVAELIDGLDARFPGLKARLVVDGGLRSGLTVIVDGVPRRPALPARVTATSEVHFIPAISGGSVAGRSAS